MLGAVKAAGSLGKSLLSGGLKGAGTAAKASVKRRGIGNTVWDYSFGAPPAEWFTKQNLPWLTPEVMGAKYLVADPIQAAGERQRQALAGYDLAVMQAKRDRLMSARQKAVETSVAESLQKLARYDPHLYQEVLWKRRLPQGARMFGGRPNMDMLTQLGYDMAANKPPGDPTDELAQLLGVTDNGG